MEVIWALILIIDWNNNSCDKVNGNIKVKRNSTSKHGERKQIPVLWLGELLTIQNLPDSCIQWGRLKILLPMNSRLLFISRWKADPSHTKWTSKHLHNSSHDVVGVESHSQPAS